MIIILVKIEWYTYYNTPAVPRYRTIHALMQWNVFLIVSFSTSGRPDRQANGVPSTWTIYEKMTDGACQVFLHQTTPSGSILNVLWAVDTSLGRKGGVVPTPPTIKIKKRRLLGSLSPAGVKPVKLRRIANRRLESEKTRWRLSCKLELLTEPSRETGQLYVSFASGRQERAPRPSFVNNYILRKWRMRFVDLKTSSSLALIMP